MEEIETYKQEVEKNPDDADAHNNLGIAYVNLDKYQEAIKSYKQAIRIDPDDADAHNGLGNADDGCQPSKGNDQEKREAWGKHN